MQIYRVESPYATRFVEAKNIIEAVEKFKTALKSKDPEAADEDLEPMDIKHMRPEACIR